MYVRRSSSEGVFVGTDREVIPRHTYATLSPTTSLTIGISDGDADILLLCGAPLQQPVVSAGSFVMSTELEISQAQSDFQRGAMGPVGWDYELDDEAWSKLVRDHWGRQSTFGNLPRGGDQQVSGGIGGRRRG